MGKRILIVEGNSDLFFFDAIIRKFGIKDVEVCPPASVKRHNGKFHAIDCLYSYAKQLLDKSIERLALVVDSDTPLQDQARGLKITLNHLDNKLSTLGFKRSSIHGGGFLYQTQTKVGKFEIGVWIMPDCQDDGSLETFVAQHIDSSSAQGTLFNHAKNTTAKIAKPLFDRDAHGLKADVATWLAWQKNPGKGIQSVVGDNLIDLNRGVALSLKNWLKKVFP